MAFDVVMFGAVTLPEMNVEEWLSTPIETSEFPWLDEVAGAEVVHDTPEALLAALSESVCAPHEFLSVTLTDGRLQLQAYLGEDRFRETAQAVAVLVASAAAFGGVGEVHFMGYQGIRFGERFTLRGSRVTYSKVAAEQLAALEHHASFQLLDARIHERFDSLVGRPDVREAKGSRWEVSPFTGRKVRVAAQPKHDPR